MTGQDARVRIEWGQTGADVVSTGATLGGRARPAARHGPLVGRGVEGGVSLSPASIAAAQGVDRLVLPSRNGSAIALAPAERGTTVVAGALRNRADGSLRPGLEDLWGPERSLTALAACGVGALSPEAAAAAAAFDAVTGLESALSGCTSGRELVESGFAEDVRIAGQLDVSDTVPERHPSVGSFSGQRGAGWAPSR